MPRCCVSGGLRACAAESSVRGLFGARYRFVCDSSRCPVSSALTFYPSLDVENQTYQFMSFRQYCQYFTNDRLPPQFRTRAMRRHSGTTWNLLAFPVYPDERYGITFHLPHLVKQCDFTMLTRDMEWDDWKLPMLMCILMSKANSYDVS